jgi:hypothetical protein
VIDNVKKITFYFSQIVSKCTVFLHLHLKYAKSAIMTQTNFFLKNINMGIKKRPLQKLKAKNHEKMHKNESTPNSHSFLALAFFGAFV